MSRMGDAGMTSSLKELRNLIKEISKDVADIKKMLEVPKENVDDGMYPWHNEDEHEEID